MNLQKTRFQQDGFIIPNILRNGDNAEFIFYLFILKCYIFFKSLLEFFTILLLFCVLLWPGGMRDLSSPTSRIETTPPALEDEVLTIEQPGKLAISALQELYLSCASIGLIKYGT